MKTAKLLPESKISEMKSKLDLQFDKDMNELRKTLVTRPDGPELLGEVAKRAYQLWHSKDFSDHVVGFFAIYGCDSLGRWLMNACNREAAKAEAAMEN